MLVKIAGKADEQTNSIEFTANASPITPKIVIREIFALTSFCTFVMVFCFDLASSILQVICPLFFI